MKRRGKYVVGELFKGSKYQDIGHSAESILWWQDNKGVLHEHVSEGKIGDFHTQLMNGKDDVWWRGRSTKNKGGVVTILPPVRVYAKDSIDLPDDLFSSLERRFKPKTMLIDTPYQGLKRVAKREGKNEKGQV